MTMRNIMNKTIASNCLITFVAIISAAICLYGQDLIKKAEKTGEIYIHNAPITEDRNIENAYAKLIRYQLAKQDSVNIINRKKSTPDDFIKIAIYDIVETTYDDYMENINNKTDKIDRSIAIKREEFCIKNDICHLAYDVQWIDARDSAPTIILPAGKLYKYFVKLQFRNIEKTYTAYAAYDSRSSTHIPVIFDPVIPQINVFIAETLPPVRGLWNEYVTSPVYWKVQQILKDKNKKNEDMIPSNAPIGYLPGDEIEYSIKLHSEFLKSSEKSESDMDSTDK